MRNKIIASIFVVIILSNLVSAFLISDQGTNVKEVATGNLTSLANLTISIYDNMTGGNLIFEQNFSNGIVNGSWNVIINPDLEYGISYYKDYKINNEDLDFDGNERLEFQSSVGEINNASFINFSLIGTCAEGTSIRQIYTNGSVVCETDDNAGTLDLSNYALKNQSETFTGNITTIQTGFFGWLGSLTSRITKLFVQDINFNGTINGSGSINITGNITADYFIGDGSLLTNLPAGSGDNASWNQSLADTLYADISVTGDNSSWNESYANTLYLAKGNEGNLNVNSSDYWDSYDTANTTWFENIAGALSLKLSQLDSYLNTWLGTKTTDNLTEGLTNLYDNSSWNESHADSLYVNVDGDTMTGELNMSSQNITSVDCITFNSGGSICSI